MALTAVGRKALLEHGRQKVVAGRARVSPAYVSAVNACEWIPKTRRGWEKYRRVQLAIARELGLDVTEAFAAFERGEVQQEAVAVA